MTLKQSAFCEKDFYKRVRLVSGAFFHPSSSMEDRWEMKLWALRQIAIRRGMIGPHRTEPVPPRNEEKIAACLAVVSSPQAPSYQKGAASILLDYYEPNWKENHQEIAGHITDRSDREVAIWRRNVLLRDGNVCQNCGTSEKIEAHHIMAWIDFPYARLVEENGIALCRSCHDHVHAGRINLTGNKVATV
jgi:hypothetical protein